MALGAAYHSMFILDEWFDDYETIESWFDKDCVYIYVAPPTGVVRSFAIII